MHTFLYIIWFALPTLLFVMALWSKLEQMSGSPKKQDPIQFFKQALFLLACVLLAVTIDTFFLKDLWAMVSPEFITLGFWQVMLLPVILIIGAKLIGGSKVIRISSARRSPPAGKGRRG